MERKILHHFLLTCILLCITSNTSFAQKSKDEKLKNGEGLFALIETNKGEFLLQLEMEKYPLLVANFVGLAEGTIPNDCKPVGTPFYDGCPFHYAPEKGYTIETGYQDIDSVCSAGYRLPIDEPVEITSLAPGLLSPGKSRFDLHPSHFMVTKSNIEVYDTKTIFYGKVIRGQETVDNIAKGDSIIHVKIIRKGKAAKQFNAFEVWTLKMEAHRQKILKEKKEREAAFKAKVLEAYPNAKSTASGLMYIISDPGVGDSIVEGLEISVHHEIRLLDGTLLQSTYEREHSYTFEYDAKHWIEGYSEALSLLREKGKGTFFIPARLGFGAKDGGSKIPPYSDLIIVLEIVKIH